MSQENPRVLKRVLAAAAAFVVVLALSASAAAAPVTPFREVAVVEGAVYIGSDGARFAWATDEQQKVLRVFDTLRGRNFELTAPGPGCGFEAIGRGIAVWGCFPPETKLLTSLSTGRSRRPAGIESIEREAAEPDTFCRIPAIGRYWLEYNCRGTFGPGGDVNWLNHRTGRITGGVELEDELFSPEAPFVDLDHRDLFRPYCTPLGWPHFYTPPYLEYAPPLAVVAYLGTGSDSIRLRRCGKQRAEILGRCLIRVCRTPQLGSRYVTWGEDRRVYGYLPAIKRRVLVGRSPAYFLSVAHTCNQIFGLSPRTHTVYAARFEPARGAPPCQSKR
jgi:hypothetical protein